MFQQDVELAKLLVEKVTRINERGEELKKQLTEAESELGDLNKVREERENYLDVLSRAAQLLDRSDLQVDSPATNEVEQKVTKLRQQLDAVEKEAGEYREVMQDLVERAPQLVEAAGIRPDGSIDSSAGEKKEDQEEDEDDDEEESSHLDTEDLQQDLEGEPEDSDDPERDDDEYGDDEEYAELEDVEDDSHASEMEEGFEAAGATGSFTGGVRVRAGDSQNGQFSNGAGELEEAADSAQPAVAVEAADNILDRFNVQTLRQKEAFTFGRNAAFVVDGESVLERVPIYDTHVRAANMASLRGELMRDIGVLSHKIAGTYAVVFNADGDDLPGELKGVEMTISNPSGGSSREDCRQGVRDKVSELATRHRNVCVVTGDDSLAGAVKGQGIHILKLSDFFLS